MVVDKLKFNLKDEFAYDNIIIKFDSNISIKTKYLKVFGLGERYNKINQKGNSLINVVEEKFCYQGEKTYYPLPFFILDNGYAFFIDSKKIMKISFKDEISIDIDMVDEGSLYVLRGSYKEIIRDFIILSGGQKKSPKWAFGPWLSAHRWNSREMVEETLDKARILDIPFTVMVIEQWSDEAGFYIFNGAKYPDKEELSYEDFDFSDSPWHDPKEMIEELHKDGIKLILWQCPVIKYIPEDEPRNLRHEKLWERVCKEEMAVLGSGGMYRIPKGNWFEGSMIPDFTNEKMKKIWFENRQYLLDIGVDGFKTDGGEFIYENVLNKDGEDGKDLKNNYSLEYVKAYSDFLGSDRLAFSRAGYIGASAYSAYWAGDQKSTFEELKSVYNAGINMSVCGNINWGFDIGGFSGELPELELIYRAHQLGVFVPIMQVHSEPVGGQFSIMDPVKKFNNERTPWNLAGGDEEILKDIRKLYNLRMNIIPYIYSEYLKALEENSTLMKASFIEYEEFYVEEEYFFGDLMIAPVLSKGCIKKEIVFPEGITFYNIFTNEKYSGKVCFEDIKITDVFAFISSGTALVLRTEEVIPDSIDNSLEYDKLYFRLYGEEGSYRFVDEKNDFIIIWNNDGVKVEGKQISEIGYKII